MNRVLFVTIVPPFPDDQGNRVVTKSVMDHFLGQGCELDVVMQSGLDRSRYEESYGSRVNTHFTQPWNGMHKVESEDRRKIRELADSSNFDGYHSFLRKQLKLVSVMHHPFSYITDETIHVCRKLLESNRYEKIVFNYAYSLRVASELKELLRGASTYVITHDALSRLGDHAVEFGMDTSYRATSREIEAKVLNEADYVLAISEYELSYFKRIGVRQEKLRLSEFFISNSALKNLSFERNDHQVFYGASGNELNRSSFDLFLKESWPNIVSIVPEARLVVTGSVCDYVESKNESIILKGRVTYEEMLNHLSESTVAINPVTIGTGIKIKCVESIILSTPVVSTETGMEGIDVRCGVVVEDGNWRAFSNEVIALIQDKKRWKRVSKFQTKYSKKRFREKPVMEKAFK